ncbi:MAG: BtrH N-terminal domain-containing protein [Elusimicrobiota bacterium]
MTEKLVLENFNYFGGKHCQTTALKSILAYHGLQFSEEMLFGLGGGVGFIYWYIKFFMPYPFIGTRNSKVDEFVIKICRRLGIEATLWKSSSCKKGYEEVKKLLRDGEPVYVFVDMAYLPYMALPKSAHFGGHAITVFGIDEYENKVYISDRGKNAVTINISDFQKARSSQSRPFPAKNKLIKIKCSSTIGDLENGIREAIKDCCKNMLQSPIKNIGLAGIQKWASIVPKWNKQFDGMNLLGCLLNTFIYIEIGGTGGSAFRPMYTKFLRESAEILKKPELNEIAKMFEKSALAWSGIAKACLPDTPLEFKKMRNLLFQKNILLEEGNPDTLDEMKKINIEMNTLTKKVIDDLQKNNTFLSTLLSNLQQKILDCYETEKKAFEKLNTDINAN